MNSPTELADKLVLIVNQMKDSETESEFTVDDVELLMNSITMFASNLTQYESNYKLSCSDVVQGLHLKCHPEGGFYRRYSWTKEKSKIFYLLPAGCVSSWHHLKGIRETWKWMYGGVLVIPQISNDFRWLNEVELAADEDVVIMEDSTSPDKWGNWFGAFHKDDDFSLVTCECTPPYEFSKFELANEQNVRQFKLFNPARAEIFEPLAHKNLTIELFD